MGRKLTKAILFLLLLTLPCQLGRHFWPDFAFVFGLKIDYLSPTFYLQDLLIIGLAIVLLWRVERRRLISTSRWLIPLLVGALINLFFAHNHWLAFFAWVRVGELVFLGWLVARNGRWVQDRLDRLLPLFLIGESFLGLSQVWRQRSLGGILWFFGERSFNLATPGIARAEWLGEVFLRPYGTFSHPNSLAGFLLVVIVLLLECQQPNWTKKLALVLGLITLGFAFSRAAWLALLLYALVFLLNRFWGKQFRFGFPSVLVLSSLLLSTVLVARTRLEPVSLTGRWQLALASLEMIKSWPGVGVGLNNFIPVLSRSEGPWYSLYWLQPVHNVFLLLAAELGLSGLLAVLFLLLLTFRAIKKVRLLSAFTAYGLLLVILFTGFFDHYWLTLVQNQLLLAVVVGLIWAR